MKKLKSLFPIIFLFVLSSVNAQNAREYFITLTERVESQGEKPHLELYNYYVDKMNSFFHSNNWVDEVLSVKHIKVLPKNDPNNWYYLAAIKTKNCTKPFYVSYDSYDLNFDTDLFIVERNFFPPEFQAYVDELRSNRKVYELTQSEKTELGKNLAPILERQILTYVNDTFKTEFDSVIKLQIDEITTKYKIENKQFANQYLYDTLIKTDWYLKTFNWVSSYHKEVWYYYDPPNRLYKALRSYRVKTEEDVLELAYNNFTVGLYNEMYHWRNRHCVDFFNQLCNQRNESQKNFENSFSLYLSLIEAKNQQHESFSNELSEKYCFDSEQNIFLEGSCLYSINKKNSNILNSIAILYSDYLSKLKAIEDENSTTVSILLTKSNLTASDPNNLSASVEEIKGKSDLADWFFDTESVLLASNLIKEQEKSVNKVVEIGGQFSDILLKIEEILKSDRVKDVNKSLKDIKELSKIELILGI